MVTQEYTYAYAVIRNIRKVTDRIKSATWSNVVRGRKIVSILESAIKNGKAHE
jgi:hypothetical protein